MEKLKVNMFVKEDQKILDSMKEAYENCPPVIKYLADLKVPQEVIDENLPKIFDFVSDINYCKNCPGVDKCQKERPLLMTRIVYNHGYLERELSPCQEFLKRLLFEKQFLVRDFPEQWLNDELRSLDKNNARKLMIAQYMKYSKEGDNSWLYLCGTPNTGRTYSAAMIAVDAAKKKKGPICFISCSQRIRELSDLQYTDKNRFQKELDRYANVPILIMDDFGNEFKNDFIRDGIIFPILSQRANKRLFTIITSDFTIEEIVTLYSTSKAGEIRAKQIGRYLRAMTGEEINFGDVPRY